MRELYSKNEANYPRLSTDKCFADYGNEYKYEGFIAEVYPFLEKKSAQKSRPLEEICISVP